MGQRTDLLDTYLTLFIYVFFLLLQKDLRQENNLRHLGESNENKAKSETKNKRSERMGGGENILTLLKATSATEHRICFRAS